MITSLTEEALGEASNDTLELSLEVLAESALLVDGGEQLRLISLEVSDEVGLPAEDLADRNAVEETADTGKDQRNHLVDSHRGVLLLLEKLGQLIWVSDTCFSG